MSIIKPNRRSLLLGAGGMGAAALLGLGSGRLRAQDAPARGGTFRLAIADFDSGETLDPQMAETKFVINLQWQIRNCLIELGPGGVLIPELATSWEPSADLTSWVFKLRPGVEFHNGKTLTPEDVVWSINLHRGPDTVSMVKAVALQITDVRATAPDEVTITLAGPNATFPTLMAVQNFLIVPENDPDLDRGVGTGGYVLEVYEPGIRGAVRRNPNYWKEGRAHFDSVETLAVKDVTARMTALQTGQIDAMNFVDPTTAALLKAMPGIDVLQTQSGVYNGFAVDCTAAPYSDNRVRLALKYAVDRQEMLEKILGGFGSIANDQPISATHQYYDPDFEQHVYDPDRARALMKEAEAEGVRLQIHVSDTPYTGAVTAAQLYAEQAARAGIAIEVLREPEDGYWSNIWGKRPFFATRWARRPSEDVHLTLGFTRESIGSWNESSWDHEALNAAIVAARGEPDDARRRELYAECQRIISAEGGLIAPLWADNLDAKSQKVATGPELAGNLDLDGARASERWWFAA